MIALDTNVLVRFTNKTDAHFPAVSRRIEELADEGHDLVIAAQSIYEYWCVATRPAEVNGLGLSVAQTERAVQLILGAFKLLPDPPDLLHRWLYLCIRYEIKGLVSHDARVVAWMISHQIDQLYTLNGDHFERYEEIDLV